MDKLTALASRFQETCNQEATKATPVDKPFLPLLRNVSDEIALSKPAPQTDRNTFAL
jgi:hypothetical protein